MILTTSGESSRRFYTGPTVSHRFGQRDRPLLRSGMAASVSAFGASRCGQATAVPATGGDETAPEGTDAPAVIPTQWLVASLAVDAERTEMVHYTPPREGALLE